MKFRQLTFYLVFACSIAQAFQLYCKCQCNEKTIINTIDECKSCTKEYCLLKDSKLCEVELKEKINANDVEADQDIIISCYQIESLKDELIIYSFIITVLGLLAWILYSTSAWRTSGLT